MSNNSKDDDYYKNHRWWGDVYQKNLIKSGGWDYLPEEGMH